MAFPELQRLYAQFQATDKVALYPSLHFGHNYNHVSRVAMYGWVNRHFALGQPEPILEKEIEYLGKEELTFGTASIPCRLVVSSWSVVF